MSRPPARAAGLGLLLVAGALLAGCTGSDPSRPDPAVQAEPPAPPAACILDTAGLATATGLSWVPDASTATDTRCVYDPAGSAAAGPDGPVFIAVDIAPARGGAAGAELDEVAGVCDDGSRAPVPAGDGGFVCRFQGGSVLAATVSSGKLVTVAASAVPAGTTAAQLVVELGRQLATFGS